VGILLGFIAGDAAKTWSNKGKEARKARFLEDVTRYFGAAAANPIDYLDCDWIKETWSKGGFGGHMPPGVIERYGRALRDPVGSIHWAGPETSTIWSGYIDGAIRSGERAAKEILDRW
jgi:monoamine oxidase